MKSAHLNGFILGFTNAVMFFAIAAAFSLGAYLIENKKFNQNLESIMLVFNCVLFGAQSVGKKVFNESNLGCKTANIIFLNLHEKKMS